MIALYEIYAAFLVWRCKRRGTHKLENARIGGGDDFGIISAECRACGVLSYRRMSCAELEGIHDWLRGEGEK